MLIAVLLDPHVRIAELDLLDITGLGVFNVDLGLLYVALHGLVQRHFTTMVFRIRARPHRFGCVSQRTDGVGADLRAVGH